MVRKRVEEKSNYKAFFVNGKTLRFAIDPTKPIKDLEYPEFYDVDIFETGNGLCRGGCSYCYLSGNKNGKIVPDAAEKIKNYFGAMSENQKPFQVALPGSGEIFEHPDWYNIFESFNNLGILPNYTTNGMWSKLFDGDSIKDIILATKKLCGGVAVSCHPHLEEYWKEAVRIYYRCDIKVNLHIIISDKESVDYFKKIYNEFSPFIEYFVLLPYGNQGRAEKKEIEWEYLVENLPENHTKLAFGANFYSYLMLGQHNIKISLYEPEIMSKFLSLDTMTVHGSSFNLND